MTPLYYNAFEQGADLELHQEIRNILEEAQTSIDNIVILCIGTDRATGEDRKSVV